MQVQTQMAADTLNQFNVPLNISLISKANDWQTRQKAAYAAVVDYIRQDFHGLNDFKEQMQMYSTALGLIGTAAYKVIQPLIPFNRNVLETEVDDPEMGMVGKFLLTLLGFNQVFAMTPQTLQDPSIASSALASATSNAPQIG